MYDAPLSRPTFLQDNYRVYQSLIQWTSGGTAETYVDTYTCTQHGRDVWLALIATYEGADARNANVQETQTLLESLKYEKDSHNFTFDDYCTKTITYNNDLTRYGANVDGRSQVAKVLTGITRTDMKPIKISIMRDATCKDDLFKAVSDFKTSIRRLSSQAPLHSLALKDASQDSLAAEVRAQAGKELAGAEDTAAAVAATKGTTITATTTDEIMVAAVRTAVLVTVAAVGEPEMVAAAETRARTIILPKPRSIYSPQESAP